MAFLFLEGFDKDMAAGDAHVTTALGNAKGKAKTFNDLAGKTASKTDVPEPAQTKRFVSGVPRHLKPIDAQTSHTPFPYDASALSKLREDQVPRFFGALTDSHMLPERRLPLDSLVAMQNRVDTGKVAMAGTWGGGKPPVVVHMNGRHYIADGHHRLSAAYLRGDEDANCKYLDLSPVSQALKSDFEVPLIIKSYVPEQQLIFGWASVVEKDGRLVIDKQGDIILPEDLENAAYDFVLTSRQQGDMHKTVGVGRLVESCVFTKEKQEAMGITLPGGMIAWWTGFKVDDAPLWEAHKRGERPEFSIGGAGRRVEV